jgi:hypothetical protein
MAGRLRGQQQQQQQQGAFRLQLLRALLAHLSPTTPLRSENLQDGQDEQGGHVIGLASPVRQQLLFASLSRIASWGRKSVSLGCDRKGARRACQRRENGSDDRS